VNAQIVHEFLDILCAFEHLNPLDRKGFTPCFHRVLHDPGNFSCSISDAFNGLAVPETGFRLTPFAAGGATVREGIHPPGHNTWNPNALCGFQNDEEIVDER
jgi:hypothetical protein